MISHAVLPIIFFLYDHEQISMCVANLRSNNTYCYQLMAMCLDVILVLKVCEASFLSKVPGFPTFSSTEDWNWVLGPFLPFFSRKTKTLVGIFSLSDLVAWRNHIAVVCVHHACETT